MQSLKTSQDRSGSISLFQANIYVSGSEKIVILRQKICRVCRCMLPVLNADNPTTTTLSYAKSEVEASTIQLWILKL